jgi:hypothetical protein
MKRVLALVLLEVLLTSGMISGCTYDSSTGQWTDLPPQQSMEDSMGRMEDRLAEQRYMREHQGKLPTAEQLRD